MKRKAALSNKSIYLSIIIILVVIVLCNVIILVSEKFTKEDDQTQQLSDLPDQEHFLPEGDVAEYQHTDPALKARQAFKNCSDLECMKSIILSDYFETDLCSEARSLQNQCYFLSVELKVADDPFEACTRIDYLPVADRCFELLEDTDFPDFVIENDMGE